ncbi:MAG TPA: response regulator [Planctomycetes bacterium]|nr:response regulator [Planctomycetota bacterium]
MSSESTPPPLPATEASSDAAAQLHLILEAPSIIIFSLDRSFRYTSFNRNHAKEMERIWGCRIRVGMDMLHLIPDPADRAKARRNFERALAGDEFTLVESYGDDELTRCFYEDRYCPTRDADGTIVGVTVFVTDVTQHMREAEERLRLQERLQRAAKVESLEVMAGGIAHDFNNLLGAILGFAEVAREHLPDGHESVEPIELIQDAAERAGGLTRQLLAFTGRGQETILLCDLEETVSSMEDLLRAAVPKAAELRFELESGLRFLRADPAQLQQVVTNLVLNAAQALEQGSGTILVSTRPFEVSEDFACKQPLIYRVEPGPFCILEVTDDGAGIEPELQQRVLEPFYSTRPDGRGLGLAAVQGIVRSLGGFLEIESEVGRGTSVRAGFPCSPRSPEIIPHPASKTPRPRTSSTGEREAGDRKRKARILASDDEESVRTLLARALTSKGYEVELVLNGEQALERFRADPACYDLLILDLTTPRLSGLEALRRLRPENPRAPVLLMSGYWADDVLADLENDPYAAFIHKPFRLAELIGRIEELLSEGRGISPG